MRVEELATDVHGVVVYRHRGASRCLWLKLSAALRLGKLLHA